MIWQSQEVDLTVEEAEEYTAQIGSLITVSEVYGGLPSGGNAGEILIKNSDEDYDAIWGTIKNGANIWWTSHLITQGDTAIYTPKRYVIGRTDIQPEIHDFLVGRDIEAIEGTPNTLYEIIDINQLVYNLKRIGNIGENDYNKLLNKPQIDGIEINKNSTSTSLGLATASALEEKYSKPSGGIPATDLASTVQTSLGKADTALQSVDATLSNAGEAADAAVTGAGINAAQHTADYAVRFAETLNNGAGIPLDAEWLANDVTGSRAYRVHSKRAVNTEQKVLQAASGFRFYLRIYADGGYSNTDWYGPAYSSRKTYTLPKGADYSICVGAYPEDTSVTADPDAYGAQITIQNNIGSGSSITVDDALSSSSENPVQNKVIKAALDAKGTYSKPSGGIPATDLASAVQTSLGKADTALQSVDPTLSNTGEAADAAATGAVKELADAVAERIYDYSTSIADNDITALRGKNITSAKNIEDNASYSVLYFTAPATGHYKVISTTSSQLNGYIYSSTSMSSSTYVGYVPRDDTVLIADLEQGQVLGVRAKSTTFTISVSYATTYTVEMKQSLPLTETMDGQIKTLLNFPDELQLPLSVAHRGLATNSTSIIENTMPAFEDAVSKGWRYLETDIRFTSDDVCVLLHDATIAAGVNISDITYAQALTYDLGSGATIATLEELLQLCRKSHVYPVIEVKDSTISQTHVDIVWALIQKYEMEHECFFLCSSSGGVTPFLAKDPYVSTVMTGTSAWTVIDPADFGEHPLGTTGKKWLSGKNKMFYEKETSAFADLAAQENFIDWCHYWGFFAGIYCPTTQAALDNKSKRFDMVTSQYYKYEVERSYSGGGGSSVEPYISNPAALGTASPGTSDKYARGDHVHAKPTAADIGAYALPFGGIPASDLADDVHLIPAGGSEGYILKKNSNNDYDVIWAEDNIIEAEYFDFTWDGDHKPVPATGVTGEAIFDAIADGKLVFARVIIGDAPYPYIFSLHAYYSNTFLEFILVEGPIIDVLDYTYLSGMDSWNISYYIIPDPAQDIPADLGVAAVGSSGAFARADHVHAMPSAVDIGAYVKPNSGIPSSDLSSGVQTSLGKADTALQSVPSTYRTAAAQDTIDAAQDTAIAAIKGVHWCTYGTTTDTEIQAAIDAGKLPAVNYNDTVFLYHSWASNSGYTFSSSYIGGSERVACKNGVWSTGDLKYPAASNSAPPDLGVAARGTSDRYARQDHVHKMPSAADVGAIATPSSPSLGQYLQYDGDSWEAVSLPAIPSEPSDIGAYALPSGGIPETDLASAVQTSLGKADTALQPGDVAEPYFVTYSTSDMTNWTCDKTFAQITAAIAAEKDISVSVMVGANRVAQTCEIALQTTGGTHIELWIRSSRITWNVAKHYSDGTISVTNDGLTYADVDAVASDQGSAHAGEFLVVGSDGVVVPEDNRFVVTLTPTNPDFSGTMDKTPAEVYSAYAAGKRIIAKILGFYGAQDTYLYVEASYYAAYEGAAPSVEVHFMTTIEVGGTPCLADVALSRLANTFDVTTYPLATGQWAGGSY